MFPNTFLVGFFLLYFGIFSGSNGRFNDKSEIFSFPEYAYKQTNKNELTYREFEVACENSKSCLDLEGVDKVKCTRECISQKCYQDIYAFDELEEGEIDVRLNSFKGCVIQRTTGRRK